MTKKLITRTKEFNVTYDSVEDIIKIFNEEKSKLPSESYLSSELTVEEDYDCQHVNLTISYCTEQTEDEERAERLAELNRLDWKRKQLAALKKELGE